MSGENKYNCEYAVPKKSVGKYKTQRLLVRIAYWAVPLIIIFSVLATPVGYGAFLLVPAFLVIVRPVVNGTWRYVNYDQRYEIYNAGTMRFSRYYGKKFKVDKNDEHADEKIAEKFIFEIKIKDFETVAPYNDPTYRKMFDGYKIEEKNIIDHTSFHENPNVYYGIYTNEAGEKAAVLFDMIDKSMGIMYYYNKNTVVTELHFAGEKLEVK